MNNELLTMILTRPRAIWSHPEPVDTKRGKEIQLIQINEVLKEALILHDEGKTDDCIDEIKGIIACLRMRGYDKDIEIYPDDFLQEHKQPKLTPEELVEKWKPILNI